MKKRILPALLLILCGILTSCSGSKYEATDIRLFCPSIHAGYESEYDDDMIYYNPFCSNNMATAGGRQYLIVDEGINPAAVGEMTDELYLLRSQNEQWERIATISKSTKNGNNVCHLLVGNGDTLYAVTEVDTGICVYQFMESADGMQVFPYTYQIKHEPQRKFLNIGAVLDPNASVNGMIYMVYSINRNLYLLQYDIAYDRFEETDLKVQEALNDANPFLFLRDDGALEFIAPNERSIVYYLLESSDQKTYSVSKSLQLGSTFENYSLGMDFLSDGDAAYDAEGNLHVIYTIIDLDNLESQNLARSVIKDGIITEETVLMPNSHNMIQMFNGLDGELYFVLIQDEHFVQPVALFSQTQIGDPDGWVQGALYLLDAHGVEELSEIYIDHVPYVKYDFLVCPDEHGRTFYLYYKGWFTNDLVTCKINY